MNRKDIFIIILGCIIYIIYEYIRKKISFLATDREVAASINKILNIQDCLKKNYNKNKLRNNKDIVLKNLGNIPIYYINLERSPERKKYMKDQFEYYGITNYHRIDGVDGKKIRKWYDINNIEQGEVVFSNNSVISYSHDFTNFKKVSDNQIGCSLSHIKAIKTAYDKGHNMVYIMEDDVSLDLIPYWEGDIYTVIDKIPNIWDTINLCPDRWCYENKGVFADWRKVPPCWGVRCLSDK
jgi:hypothetical protein